MIYDKEIPNYGDLIPVDEFISACKSAYFIDYDGFGNPAKNGKMADFDIFPSKVSDIPKDATHIVWYNR